VDAVEGANLRNDEGVFGLEHLPYRFAGLFGVAMHLGIGAPRSKVIVSDVNCGYNEGRLRHFGMKSAPMIGAHKGQLRPGMNVG
jgi:hypothetical protein